MKLKYNIWRTSQIDFSPNAFSGHCHLAGSHFVIINELALRLVLDIFIQLYTSYNWPRLRSWPIILYSSVLQIIVKYLKLKHHVQNVSFLKHRMKFFCISWNISVSFIPFFKVKDETLQSWYYRSSLIFHQSLHNLAKWHLAKT